MKRMIRAFAIVWATLFYVVAISSAHAAVRLPAVFGNHMVIQRDMPVPVWGWADAGAKVTVQFAGQSVTTTAGANGKWQVKLSALKASDTGRDLVVKAGNTLTLHDVLVGEVWLCAGQSNMEFAVNGHRGGAFHKKDVMAAAHHPTIRLINVPNTARLKPADNFKGRWQVCSPKTVGRWTAAGYFFATQLHKQLEVPIGLVEADWGGTRIQPWIAPAGWRMVPALRSQMTSFKSQANANGRVSKQTPTCLYNGMIAPIQTFAIRGALWYQGESNVGGRHSYFQYLQGLVGGWRSLWGQGNFPFILVQIAPFGVHRNEAPRIWAAEMKASREIQNVGLISTLDIGNLRRIHPRDKQDVGKRLALWALANVYGREGLVCSGPTFAGMKVLGHEAVIHFDHLGGGLTTRDHKRPSDFQIAGTDGSWYDAQAKIEGDTVVVISPEVNQPTAVRFAWRYNAQPNLENKAGLPAMPFDTNGQN